MSGSVALKVCRGGLDGSGKLVVYENGSMSFRYWTLHVNDMMVLSGPRPDHSSHFYLSILASGRTQVDFITGFWRSGPTEEPPDYCAIVFRRHGTVKLIQVRSCTYNALGPQNLCSIYKLSSSNKKSASEKLTLDH